MPTAKAGAQCRVSVPSPPPQHGGRRGQWGRPATGLMPKSTRVEDEESHRAKSLVNSLSLRISRYLMAMVFEDLSR
jgi:hypothetical protein